MDVYSIIPILQKIPLFCNLSESSHKEIIDRIIMEYYPANAIIFLEGEQGVKLYIIKSGLLKVFKHEQDREIELTILGQNEFFGEMALISDEPRNASVRTLEESEIFTLNKNDFLQLTSIDQNIAGIINDEFIRRVKANQKFMI